MGPLTFVALVGVAGWLAWRTYGPRPTRHRAASAAPKPQVEPTRLVRDPVTGVYRPADD
ncbi:MAG: hypothetical protein KIS96_03930 [Bauldia sp.]|nr:hypothetical protein [Bauldia sp.]